MSPPIRAGRTKLENVFQIRTPRGVLYGQISHESSGKSRLTRRKVYRYLGTYTSISSPEFRNGTSDKKTRDDARKEELKKTTEEQRRKSILKKYRKPRKQRPGKRDAWTNTIPLIRWQTVSIYTTFHEKNPGGLNIPTIIFTFVEYWNA